MSTSPRRQLRVFLDKNNVSVAELAARVGISRQHLHKLLTDDSDKFPSRKTAARIAEAAKVPAEAWDALYRRSLARRSRQPRVA